MRDIEFRGLCVNGKNWYFGNLAIIKKDVTYGPKAGHYISNSVGMPFAYQVRPESVGQFIGLNDRNLKKIYEGDIIAENIILPMSGGKRSKRITEVVWDINCFNVPRMSHLVEVIGNIYQHHDLLKNGQQTSNP